VVKLHSSTLSNPITFTLDGTLTPRSARPRNTPIATVSGTQNTPSNSSPGDHERSDARWVPRMISSLLDPYTGLPGHGTGALDGRVGQS
jgi:hypothetical protein